MSVAAETSACPLCGGFVGAGDKECAHCHATPQWQDYARAVAFAQKAFAGWRQRGIIGESNHERMEKVLLADRQSIAAAVQEARPFPSDTGLPSQTACWRCGRPVAGFYSYCNTCGAPLGAGADALRYLAFVSNEITRASAIQLTLAQAHACAADVRGHLYAMRAELERGRLSDDQLASERLSRLRDLKSGVAPAESGPAPQAPAAVESHRIVSPPPLPPAYRPTPVPRRSILEILLDPRSIQWLLASGGVLLVVGLVIWLASLGVFKNTLVVATCLGAGTLVLLAGGCATVRLSRYQLAGRALALLACLVMPLNLWFYHAHGLVTLEGHLWLAALVCCVLYSAAAAILEDPVFVYVLMAGVAMTGCMILADLHKLIQVAAPSTLLVALGLISLHAERAFAEGDGPFSRKRFGMACFWSAQALLGAGLLLLLGAQLVGWIPMAMSWLDQRPLIVTDPTQRLLAVALVLAGAYAYLYSDLVVRRVGVYVYFAAFMLLWAELLVIDLAKLTNHPSGLIGILALTSLAVNVVQAMVFRKPASESSSKLARPLPTLGLLLSSVPVLLGVILHVRATRLDVHNLWPYSLTWAYVAAMVLTAVCCRISAYLHERSMPRLAAAYLFATAAATLVGAAGLLSMLGIKAWPVQSPLLMLIPIFYLLASRLYQGRPAQRPLAEVAHAATVVLLFSVLFSALNLAQRLEPVVGLQTNLLLSLVCAEAAVFYAAAAILYGGGRNVYLATAMACGAVWQLLNFWSVRAEYYCVTFAVLGTALLAAYRFAAWERVARPALVVAAFRCANALMSLSFVAAALMALSRLATDHTDWSLAVLLAVFSVLGFVAAGLVRHPGFRRWYITVTVAEAALSFIILQKQIHLSPWQNIELFCVAVGVIMLAIGYGLWYREQDCQSDAASFCLLFGSLLAGVPLAVAAIVNRFGYEISLMDELGLATVSILMFVTGFMCRLRATTLVGGCLLVIHLAMLLVFAGMRAQLAVGIYLAIGGGVIFALGVLLSIYRDRLLALPQRIRHHEGVFGVLAWR
ncbi:MAG: hypothetical protein ABSB42_17435 [Tepidisphaeraceae bacterium]|jgi:hypothetical protein